MARCLRLVPGCAGRRVTDLDHHLNLGATDQRRQLYQQLAVLLDQPAAQHFVGYRQCEAGLFPGAALSVFLGADRLDQQLKLRPCNLARKLLLYYPKYLFRCAYPHPNLGSG